MNKHINNNNTPDEIICEERDTITLENVIYELSIRYGNDCISFLVKSQLPYSIYEGIYSLAELSKKAFFRNYDDTISIFNKLNIQPNYYF